MSEEKEQKILELLKGLNVDDAVFILNQCEKWILCYSVVSYPWDRNEKDWETRYEIDCDM